MGGGLLELVAHGVQDIYLIGNPQITFFKIVYKRHTNFSMESVLAVYNGTADYDQLISFDLPRKGDLIHSMMLEIDLPAISASAGSPTYVNGIGHAIIDYVELQIGGQQIDKHYGEWMEIWTQLSYSHSKQLAYDELLPRSNIDTTPVGPATNTALTTYIPLQFWFCRNIGLALPLIALQYHEVTLKVKIKPLSEVHTFGLYASGSEPTSGTLDSNTITDVRLYIDYIYLDTYERKKFAQMKHRYLIEQVQMISQSVSANTTKKSIDLDFNHPVKSLYWVTQLNSYTNNNDIFNFTGVANRESGSANTKALTHAVIKLNGVDRFDRRKEAYFRMIQPFQRHTRVPNLHIYMYSFCLNPEAHQPSGTCNFSKINNATLELDYISSIGASTVRVYALNYNVLRIFSGMGSVAFAN